MSITRCEKSVGFLTILSSVVGKGEVYEESEFHHGKSV